MKKGFKIYALVTQFLFQTLVLTFLGYYLGTRMDEEGVLPGILAVIGAFAGIASFMYYVYRMGDKDGKS